MPREYAPHGKDSLKRKDRSGSEDLPPHLAYRKKAKVPVKEHQYPSINELKKRIRDVKRLLSKVDLPADARVVQERALAGYEKDLENETERRDRSAMIKKYHFVRFLDRKTATKDIKRLQRQQDEIANNPDLDAASKEKKTSAVAEKLRMARINLNYTIYYPLTEKYVAMYATVKKNKDAKGNAAATDADTAAGFTVIHATTAEKPAMWHVVEKCMEDGTLDQLREGKLDTPDVDATGKVSSESKKGKDKTNAKTEKSKPSSSKKSDEKKKDKRATKGDDRATSRKAVEEDGDESDGGFFEM